MGIDLGGLLDAPVPLHPLATDADTGAIVDLYDSITDVVELKTALQATHPPADPGWVAGDARR